MSNSWSMEFDVPQYQYFMENRLPSLNPGKTFDYTLSNTGHLTLSGNSLTSGGWIYDSNTETYTVTYRIIYTINQKIATLPDSFNFRAKTLLKNIGYISATERQVLMRYIKCVPIVNGNVSIELIDNPYMDRPVDKGFDGWTTHETSYNFSLNPLTYVQTLTAPVDMNTKEVTINLYVDWKDANIIFVGNGGNDSNTGKTYTNRVRSFSTARTRLENSTNYKYATNASNRELNIIVYTDGNYNGSNFNINSAGSYSTSQTKAYTLTSLYNGVDYRSGAKLRFNANMTLYCDVQYDFLNMYGGTYSYDVGTGDIVNYLIGNCYNLRIGRGVLPISGDSDGSIPQVQGGPYSRTNARNEYRLVIESGYYDNFQLGRASVTGSYTSSGTLIVGSDIERIKEDNTTLKVYNRFSSRTSAATVTGSNNKPAYTMIVKSGSIGMDYFNRKSGEYAYSGIYVGGHGKSGSDRSSRYLIVEGGDIANIIGGLDTSRSYQPITYIYVKGGSVQNIVGGAGITTTYGDRVIQVTGGNVVYCVAGGSNGYLAAETVSGVSDPTGTLEGDTLVYIGGNAKIGTDDINSTLYYANAGSVFGAGMGNNSWYKSGRVTSSHVIIDGEATIFNNVYGGGNYGVTGTASSGNAFASYTNVTNNVVNSGLYDQEFIISSQNRNNGYAFSLTSSGISTESYKTTEAPDASAIWKLESAGNNEYYLKNKEGLYLRERNNTLTSSTTPITKFKLELMGNNDIRIYRVNDYNTTYYIRYSNGFSWNTNGTRLYLLAPDIQEDNISPAAVIDILGGTVNKSVYGGANNNGGVTSNPQVIDGTTVINMVDGKVEEAIYGGCNTAGTISGATKITITGGIVGSGSADTDAVFGGGRGQNTDIKHRTLINILDQDKDVTINGDIYGGSALGKVSGDSIVNIKDTGDNYTIAIAGNVYGGGKGQTNGSVATSVGDVQVTIDGGSFPSMKVFGGANINGLSINNILVKIGENNTTFVDQVYGGGNRSNISTRTISDKVYILSNGTVTNAFNGGNEAGIESDVEVGLYVQNGTIQENAYGGSNTSGSVDHTYVEFSQSATAQNVYGGGKGDSTSIANSTEVVIKGASIIQTNVYGGGEGTGNTNNGATVNGNSTVEIIESSQVLNNVYGGGDAGPLNGTTDVTVSGATVSQNTFGGGKGNTAVVGTNTVVNIEDSTTIGDCVYGGGDQGEVSGSTSVTISNATVTNDVYGGGNMAEVTRNTSVVLIDNATSTRVFGGGNAGEVGGATSVSVDTSEVTDTLYGGGNEGAVIGNTNVYCVDGLVTNAIFGGGKAANVGSTIVAVINMDEVEGYVTKYLYGGGDQGELTGSTNVTISNANIEKEVYGGGNGSTVQTGTTIPGKVAGNTSVRLGNSTASNVFGGGNGTTAVVSGDTVVTIRNASVENRGEDELSGYVFGGGNNGPVEGSTKVGLTNATIAECAYAAGNGATAVVVNNPYIYAEGTTTIGKSIFGGGNAAMTGDTSIPTPTTDDNHPYESRYVTAIVDIAGATIGQNVYGGANSSVIQGNTVVNIGVDAIGEFYTSSAGTAFSSNNKTFSKNKIDIGGTIFGGGESMDPTKQFNYDTVSVLGNITINVNGNNYSHDDITFNKSIFGSGNASRSTGRVKKIEVKNYGTIAEPKRAVSLQRATNVIVNNSALWLSGTTDSTSAHPDGFYTLNQIGELKLKNNGVLYLRNGANKLVSFYSVVDNETTGTEDLATVTIIDKVTGTNGTTYYAKNGKIYNNAGTEILYIIKDDKILDNETSEVITEVDNVVYADTFEKNVDNRIYMYSGINLNISDDEEANDDFGEVYGMTFFGLYRSVSGNASGETSGESTGAGTEFNEGDTSEYDVALYKGMFDEDYVAGGTLDWVDRDYNRAYVIGLHKTRPEHDIVKDGFYTVYEKFQEEIPEETVITEDNYYDYNATTYVSYITPTPSNDIYYMWFAGPDQDVYYFPFNLRASKHSTLGTREVSLKGLSFPNAKLTITSVESSLIDGVGLYNKNTIPNINLNQDDANNRFGVTMKTGNSGWSMVGSTDLYYDPTDNLASYSGSQIYKIENSSTTPNLSFYFYHSNNITEARELGYYRVKMRLEYRKDALNRGFADVILDMMLITEDYNDVGFNGAITPGVQYDLFTSTTTNITSKSSFSTYFELAEPNFYSNESVIDFYEDSYRVISTEYVLPENTAITMIDRYDHTNPKYYYYVVTAADVAAGKTEYKFSDFTVMGSTDDRYNEKVERKNYYIDSLGYEYENYIFITDFKNSIFTDTPDEDGMIVKDQHYRIFLRADVDGREEILFGLLDDQIKKMIYGIYESESTINVEAELTKNKIYLGNEVYLNVDTKYDVTVRGGSRVYDTRFFDKKLGIKLTMYSQNTEGNWIAVPGSELLGMYFELDGEKYYPSDDGTTRIKIAELVSNATSSIKIGTENSTIETGHYKILVESFGSADGMYYGIEASDSAEVTMDIINELFGIDARIEPWQAVVDTTTGKVLDNSVNNIGYIAPEEHKLNFTVDYRSQLTHPYITVSLYRRKYDSVYDDTYEKVDLKDYVTNELEEPFEIDRSGYTDSVDLDFLDSIKQFEYEYKAWDTDTIVDAVTPLITETQRMPNVTFDDLELILKDNLKTGTYKVEFKLYDTYQDEATNIVEEGNTNVARNYTYTSYEYIGETYVYVIIK